MPSTIRWGQFNAGWIPSDDAINGRKNGLLRMNNVELDANGALQLGGGTRVKWGGFPDMAHTLYSRSMSGVRNDYSALWDGSIWRNQTQIGSGGETSNRIGAGFGTAFDFTLIASGATRVKDTGTGAPVNLGILAATSKPTLAATPPQFRVNTPLLAINGFNAAVKGSINNSPTFQLTANAQGLGVAQTNVLIAGAPFNWNLFSDNGGPLPTDPMYVIVQTFDRDNDTFQLDFFLDPPSGSAAIFDSYTFSATYDDFIPLIADGPIYQTYLLKIRRDQFQRIGGGSQGWESVYGYKITYQCGSDTLLTNTIGVLGYFGGNSFTFVGGDTSEAGEYEYAQVYVNNTGSYLAKSELGPASAPVFAEYIQSYINIIAPSDPQVNEIWLYRRSMTGPNTGDLDQWYRIKVITKVAGGWPASVLDNVSDHLALLGGETVNLNLVTVGATRITESIQDIVGPIQGRWYYFTGKFMYPSDIINPDLVDASIAIRTTGSNNEQFMWARAITDAMVLVGTTCDIYLLSGTYVTLPDGTVDIQYRPLGVAFPPYAKDVAVWGSTVFYMSSDGWRSYTLSGGNPSLVAPNTDLLYRDISRYGYEACPLRDDALAGEQRYPITTARNKLWCWIQDTNRYEVYDFGRQYWRPVDLGLGQITAVTTTQDGYPLAFYRNDRTIRELDINPNRLVDGATPQFVSLLTPVLDGDTPRQRKDSYTFKIRCFTGTGSLNITIINQDSIEFSVGSVSSPTGVTDQFIDISELVELVKTYQIRIEGSVSDLIIDDIAIECDIRPVQTSFLRVQGLNYGTSARKRIFSVPFQIDTLGDDVTITPLLDGVAQDIMTVNANRKASFTYKFPLATATDVQKALDYEWEIHSPTGLFEFFGFQEIKNIELFPEQRFSHVIPVTNFGNANRKRIRVWPFVMNTLGQDVTFFPMNDGIPGLPQVFNTTDFETVRYFFTTDIFAVWYSGVFSCPGAWELREVLPPDIVQVLPIARQFDQVGPKELFKYGKIKQFEIRILPRGGPVGTVAGLPIRIFMNDNNFYDQEMVVQNEIEASYFLGVPRGVGGEIVRIEIGPTCYDFHRYYMRALTSISGKDTENTWVTLPDGRETD